ncbi:pyridoxine 5'-phosphate oxidase C-terminal domain-containing protein, partial [Pseudomonas aeruginosa]|uniref:pyridoxine 5'-phosphate oxidase C-terminal domain-containing protein n=1 Tax=Pseudomonas aeruginosa TaxID=287 RepID=UPI0028B23D73
AKLTKVTDRFLDVALQYVGVIPYDESVRKAVQKQRAVYEAFPRSKASLATLADIHALRAEARRLAETDGPLPRPPGYCLFELCLESVEFWGNGTERLHERLRYDRDEGGWKHRYLQP